MTSGNTKGSGPPPESWRDTFGNSHRLLGTAACKPYTKFRVRCECPTGAVTVRRSIRGYKTNGKLPPSAAGQPPHHKPRARLQIGPRAGFAIACTASTSILHRRGIQADGNQLPYLARLGTPLRIPRS